MQFSTIITSLLVGSTFAATTVEPTFTYTKTSELVKTTSLPHMIIYESIQNIEVIQTVPGSGKTASVVHATASSTLSILPLALNSHYSTMVVAPTATTI